MGLDMYLKGRCIIPANSDLHDNMRNHFSELQGEAWGDESPLQEVIAEVGYWRKANQIHQWFVDQVQNGEDRCQPHWVSREQLKSLRDTVLSVLNSPDRAPELLPTCSGFFFGSTDYDQYYWRDLAHTVLMIDRALALPENWHFEYQSSW